MVKTNEVLFPDEKIRITYDIVLRVFEDKYGSKIFEILKSLTRQNLVVLEALTVLIEMIGEEKKTTAFSLFEETERECRSMGMPKIQ